MFSVWDLKAQPSTKKIQQNRNTSGDKYSVALLIQKLQYDLSENTNIQLVSL